MNKDLEIAKKTVKTEIQALKKLSTSFNQSSQFSKAVSLCSKTINKIVLMYFLQTEFIIKQIKKNF